MPFVFKLIRANKDYRDLNSKQWIEIVFKQILFKLHRQISFYFSDRIAVVERQVDRTLTEMVDEEKKNFGELLKASWLINFND
jgi:hypothetical protein